MKNYKNTYCNPIKIESYPQGKGEVSHRSLADPTVIYYDGKWYMYPSYKMAYISEDFKTWKHVPIEPCDLGWAPTVVEHRNTFYLLGREPYLVYKADNPLGPFVPIGELEYKNGEKIKAIDAMIFSDDDDRVYLYWTEAPLTICGIELDNENMTVAVGDRVELIKFDNSHNWECHGGANQNKRLGWMEGAWMQKIGSRYFLIYSGCGTQFATYAMGAYYSDKGPLEGFVYQNNNPICSKKYGLTRGGGHGSVVRGPNDTLWIFYTCPVAYSANFERILGMDAIGLDADGELSVVHNSDTPQWAPGEIALPHMGNATDLVSLTVGMSVNATSSAAGRNPIYATDDCLHTWWQPEITDNEKTLTVNLEEEYVTCAMRIIWRDVGLEYAVGILPGPFCYRVEVSQDNTEWKVVVDKSENSIDYLVDYEVFEPIKARFVRLVITGYPENITPGVIDFTVFGKMEIIR